MATLENALPTQVEKYLDKFNAPDEQEPSIKAYYTAQIDFLHISIKSVTGVEIHIPVKDASIFCLEMDAEDFERKILATVLSVFSRYNA